MSAAVITAVRERRTTVTAVRVELARRPELPGRAALRDLLGHVTGGSQSELEIWGMQHVLVVPGLSPCRQQHQVPLPHGVVHLDAAWPEACLAVGGEGVSTLQVGDAVIGFLSMEPDGGAAEYAIASADVLVPAPRASPSPTRQVCCRWR